MPVSAPRRVGLLFALNLALVLAFGWFVERFEAKGGPDVLDLELSFTSGAFRQILLVWEAAHLEPCVARILGGSFLAPTLAKLVGPDFAQWFVPVPVQAPGGARAGSTSSPGLADLGVREELDRQVQDPVCGGAVVP